MVGLLIRWCVCTAGGGVARRVYGALAWSVVAALVIPGLAGASPGVLPLADRYCASVCDATHLNLVLPDVSTGRTLRKFQDDLLGCDASSTSRLATTPTQVASISGLPRDLVLVMAITERRDGSATAVSTNPEGVFRYDALQLLRFSRTCVATKPGSAPKGPATVTQTETYAPSPMKPSAATGAWDDFLGSGQTNINPRTGLPDPNRIFSADGTRSIRFGPHEMNSSPTKFHYHQETWTYDPVTNNWHVDNVVQRVPLKK
jgi:hypothetical protein